MNIRFVLSIMLTLGGLNAGATTKRFSCNEVLGTAPRLLSQETIDSAVKVLKEDLRKDRYEINPKEVDFYSKKFGVSLEEFYFIASVYAASRGSQEISHFPVGAAGVSNEGYVVLGSNIEFVNASLGLAFHAERTVLALAHESGHRITSLYSSVTPCGGCRQWLNEIENGIQMRIASKNDSGQMYSLTLGDLLNSDFGPRHLGAKGILDGQIKRWSVTDRRARLLPSDLVQALERSYSPYSQSPAGAIIFLKDGRKITGSYIEQVAYEAYPALAVAFAKMVMQGIDSKQIDEVIVLYAAKERELINHRQMTEILMSSSTLNIPPDNVLFIKIHAEEVPKKL